MWKIILSFVKLEIIIFLNVRKLLCVITVIKKANHNAAECKNPCNYCNPNLHVIFDCPVLHQGSDVDEVILDELFYCC